MAKASLTMPAAVSDVRAEFEKTIIFHSCFLENYEIFLNFAKSLKKFGKFLKFL